jgi:hypothetical protein
MKKIGGLLHFTQAALAATRCHFEPGEKSKNAKIPESHHSFGMKPPDLQILHNHIGLNTG